MNRDDDSADPIAEHREGRRVQSPLERFDQNASFRPQDVEFMRQALAEAEVARIESEVPVGAIIVFEDRVIATGHNRREQQQDPTLHAEMIAIVEAARAIGSWRLEGCTLYATLEPCPMCAGAILQARIPRVVYGASDPKGGAVATLFRLLDDPRLNHQCEVVGGVLADAGGQILTQFFQQQRRLGKK